MICQEYLKNKEINKNYKETHYVKLDSNKQDAFLKDVIIEVFLQFSFLNHHEPCTLFLYE